MRGYVEKSRFAGQWLVAVAGFGLLLSLGTTLAAEEPTTDPGRRIYEIYCQNCHGPEGRGEGPTAKVLTVKPGDLTALAEANEGRFPRDRTYQVIDGRWPVPGHGLGGMPIWGLGFQDLESDSDQEPAVRHRIEQLIDFLETIQRKGPSTE